MTQQTSAAAIAQQNANFMRFSLEQPVLANNLNGSTYVAGQPINWEVPIQQGGFATRLRFMCSLTFTYTPAGSGPTVSVNAGAPYNAFQELTITFGNKQVSIHPYVSKLIKQMRGSLKSAPGQVFGNQSAKVQGLLNTYSSTVASGVNTWKFYFDIPLNAIHPQSVYGILPIGGSGTRAQIQLVPSTQLMGADPLMNTINTNGTITNVSGSVTCTVFFRDFKSLATRTPLEPILDGIPTAQIIQTQQINPLATGWNYKRFSNPYAFARLFHIVIDGQSSSTFCGADNVAGFEYDMAENTNSSWFRDDITTGGVGPTYYADIRDKFGQDLDDGVLVLDPVTMNTADPSAVNGDAYLNLTGQGFPAGRFGVNVNTVSNANGIQPRVLTWGIILNTDGIKMA